jgi:RNA polymerase sigma-70 factor, ECF subfamily
LEQFDTELAMSLQITSCRYPATYSSNSALTEGKGDRSPVPEKAEQLGSCATLLDGLRSGHQGAYEELVRKFGGRLLATARRYLRSEADACDAVQDAFLCALKSIDTFHGDSQLSTWLHRIVVNCALMHLRARRRHTKTDKVDIDELQPRFDTNGNWIKHGLLSAPAHLSVEASETRAIVRQCIDLLSDHYRTILMLRDIDGRDTEEVANLLNLASGTVRVRLHRARQALKVVLEGHADFRTTQTTSFSREKELVYMQPIRTTACDQDVMMDIIRAAVNEVSMADCLRFVCAWLEKETRT